MYKMKNKLNQITILLLCLCLLLYLCSKHWETEYVNKKCLSLMAYAINYMLVKPYYLTRGPKNVWIVSMWALRKQSLRTVGTAVHCWCCTCNDAGSALCCFILVFVLTVRDSPSDIHLVPTADSVTRHAITYNQHVTYIISNSQYFWQWGYFLKLKYSRQKYKLIRDIQTSKQLWKLVMLCSNRLKWLILNTDTLLFHYLQYIKM